MKVTAKQIAPENRHIDPEFNLDASRESIEKLSRELRKFLSIQLKKGDKILLGFSGGVDSLTLLHLLLSCPYEVHLAHFDHAWRPKSAEEAKQLARLAEALRLPFFTERAQDTKKSELEARDQRWAFFKSLYTQGGYQALLLAHHLDDQAETVLKRLFEGAHLVNLKGIQPIAHHEGMRVLRPLLTVPKASLQSCGFQGIQDETNEDPRYLRARMRTKVFPVLNELFGKNIQNSLIRLGTYAQELEELLASSSCTKLKGPFGLLVEDFPFQKAQIRYLLHQIFTEEKFPFSEPLLSQILEQLFQKSANCHPHPKIYVDRGKLFLLTRPLPQHTEWKIKSVQGYADEKGGWREMWKGRVCISIPQVFSCHFISPLPRPASIDKLWTSKGVPAFLRDCLPLVTDGQRVIGEFLTSQKPKEECKLSILAFLNN